jgi:hypothetical protein
MKADLAIVMAHRGTEDTCRRHLPYWEQSAKRIEYFSPMNSVVKMAPVRTFGACSHHGAMANVRFRYVMEMGLISKAEWVIIHEYDSLCLGELPECDPDAVTSIAHHDPNPPRPFKGHWFLHPPIIVHHSLLRKLQPIMARANPGEEAGYWDRWLGYLCEKNNILVKDLKEGGGAFSRNTIQPAEFATLATACHAGARIFHGVKSQGALDAILTHTGRSTGPQPCGLQSGRPVAELGR